MIAELALPRLGETMETGRVVAWLKQPGERFARGETLVEIESDKTVVEMPALAAGTLVEILVPAGQDADVGAPLCRYDDGSTETAPPPAAPASAPPAPVAEAAASDETAPPLGAREPSARQRTTPLARSIARQHGASLDDIAGTGRRGRIEAADVRAALLPAAATPGGLLGVNVAAGRIAYREWGTRHAGRMGLVLLHGIAGDAQTWAGLAAHLVRDGGHVIAPDLPGHGGTEIAAETIDTLVDSAVAFLRATPTAPVHLVGHSLGGAVATRVARKAADLVARLTLIAPAGLDRVIDTSFVREVARVRSGGALSHLLRRLTIRPSGLSAAQLDVMAGELARGRLLALTGAIVDEAGQSIDIVGDLNALRLPTQVLWGVQDRIIPWTQIGQLGSRTAIHLFAESGHVPQWDQPAEVAALLV